jgi:hypothetical protein
MKKCITEQIIQNDGTNMYTYGTNSTNSWNKIFVQIEQSI